VFAPANLPDAMTATLARDIEQIVRGDSFRGKLEPLGVFPTVLSRGDFAAFQLNELAKWGKAVRDSGATVD
jgi:tripartite-type tricarboxylate transporter receptor subunit TctC